MRTIPNTTVYKCEHCGKILMRKGAMEKHEETCKKNPKNMSQCARCIHCNKIQEETDVYSYDRDGAPYVSGSRMSTFFVCECTKEKMYHPKVLNWGASGVNIEAMCDRPMVMMDEPECPNRKTYLDGLEEEIINEEYKKLVTSKGGPENIFDYLPF